LKKDNFVGAEGGSGSGANKGDPERGMVGLEIDGPKSRHCTNKVEMAPQVPSMASSVAVPVYSRLGKQVGKAPSPTWSPTLTEMIAIAW